MDPLSVLVLLLLAGSRGEGQGGGGGGGGGFAFPPVRPEPAPPPPIPASVPSGPTFDASRWKLYKPLNQTIINRALELLNDASARTETIEPDHTRPGEIVRFLKLRAPQGRLSVTAWQERAPSGAVPPSALVPA